MNILVAYFSQTGNTEKVAKAIVDAASRAHAVELKKIEDMAPADLDAFDFIFIGSPLHAGGLAEPVKDFLIQMKARPGQKIAGFITHAAPAYPDQEMEGFAEPMETACRQNNAEFKGCFNCQGFLTEALHEMIKNSQNLSDEEWADMVEQMTGHPDTEDLEKAKSFTGAVLEE